MKKIEQPDSSAPGVAPLYEVLVSHLREHCGEEAILFRRPECSSGVFHVPQAEQASPAFAGLMQALRPGAFCAARSRLFVKPLNLATFKSEMPSEWARGYLAYASASARQVEKLSMEVSGAWSGMEVTFDLGLVEGGALVFLSLAGPGGRGLNAASTEGWWKVTDKQHLLALGYAPRATPTIKDQ